MAIDEIDSIEPRRAFMAASGRTNDTVWGVRDVIEPWINVCGGSSEADEEDDDDEWSAAKDSRGV